MRVLHRPIRTKITCFSQIKQQGVWFLFPTGWNASPWRGHFHSVIIWFNTLYPLCGKVHYENQVSFPRTQHYDAGQRSNHRCFIWSLVHSLQSEYTGLKTNQLRRWCSTVKVHATSATLPSNWWSMDGCTLNRECQNWKNVVWQNGRTKFSQDAIFNSWKKNVNKYSTNSWTDFR